MNLPFKAGVAARCPEGSEAAVEVVGCGSPVRDTRVLIQDDSGATLEDGQVGEIVVSGPQVVAPAADGDLHTADLGFILDGELYPVGRSTERFTIRGQNHYPSDIEAALVSRIPALRSGRVVAVHLTDETSEAGTLNVAVEAEKVADGTSIEPTIRRTVTRLFGIRVHEVRFLEPDSLPLTASGKVRRSSCVALFRT